MNEDFVTYEIAVKLKEKGFNEECLAYYTSDHTLYTNKVVLCDDKYLEVAEIDYKECLRSYNTQKDRLLRTIVDAPTIPQVLKWLREEKKIHIVIDFDGGMGWYYQIALYGLTTYEKESEHKYNSYEQTALAGIEYVLDNLI